MKYIVKIRDRELEYDYSDKSATLRTPKNEILDYDFQELGNGCYSLLLNGKSYLAHVMESDGHYTVILENQFITVHIEDEMSLLLKQLTKHHTQETGEQIIKAPIPGLVTQVLVKEGDTVENDSTLLTLEAMKMENVIKAPCNCRVKKVLVKPGATVQQDQVLIELQENDIR